MNEPIHIKPIDIEGAKYCIEQLLSLKTNELTKDKKSKEIIDDCVRNTAQYLTSIVERQKSVDDIVDSVYKKMIQYNIQSNNNLSNIKDTMSEQKKINETTPTAMPTGAIFNMVMNNKFNVDVSEMPNNFEFMPSKVTLPPYKTDINSLESNTLRLEAVLIRRTNYFGKPTKITNVWTNQDVVDFIEEFNGRQPQFLSVTEFNNYDEAAIVSTFHYPHIASVQLCNLSAEGGTDDYKKLLFTITFERMENERLAL